ncbi:MAG: hypothetical protein ABSF28_10515 [Terracidiphilus sp.]
MTRKVKGQLRFSDHFGIRKTQSQLDFVDVPLDTDIELYVDPYALHVSPVDWLRTCGDLVTNYFELLLQTLRDKDEAKAFALLSNLREPNETRLGQSKGSPSGRGWGKLQAKQLYDRLSKSKAVSSGRLKDLSDFELLMPGIGSDKISDLTINVIRGELVAYTQEQCDLYGVATEQVPAGVFWNPDDQRWEAHYAHLPVYEDVGVLLVPKVAVRRQLVPDYEEFYTHYVLRFLEAEHLNAGSALVHTLKNGNPRIYKEDLRARYRLSKDFLFDFSDKHPAVLNDYKKILPEKAAEMIADESIEGKQIFSRLIDRRLGAKTLKEIQPGQADASKYQKFILGALTEIFYPVLTRAAKEQAVDDGRKRIDIFFHNSASKGFFSWLVNVHHYHAPYISIECKNYSSDPVNPEFDQLIGRLNRKRGFVGIMGCRTIEDRALMLKRCRDVVNNNDKQLILVLDDNDIIKLLDFAAAREQKKIDEYMEDRLKEILT